LLSYIDPRAQTAGEAPEDLRELATRTVRYYSTEYGLNAIWKLCLYEGWRRVSTKEGSTVRGPTDPKFERVLEATRIRQSEIC
jgi:hypothetical protein